MFFTRLPCGNRTHSSEKELKVTNFRAIWAVTAGTALPAISAAAVTGLTAAGAAADDPCQPARARVSVKQYGHPVPLGQ